jgi:hypothetical protein
MQEVLITRKHKHEAQMAISDLEKRGFYIYLSSYGKDNEYDPSGRLQLPPGEI